MCVFDAGGMVFERGEFAFSEVSGALRLSARFEDEVCVGDGDVVAVDLAGLKGFELGNVGACGVCGCVVGDS